MLCACVDYQPLAVRLCTKKIYIYIGSDAAETVYGENVVYGNYTRAVGGLFARWATREIRFRRRASYRKHNVR